MKFQFLKNKFVIGGVSAAAVFLFGFWVGADFRVPEIKKVVGLENLETGQPEFVDFSAFWKAWNILNDRYMATKQIPTDQEKVYGAIGGLTVSLGDPYTVFFPPEEKKNFEADISGHFDGVGMEIDAREGVIVVVAPLKGNPAERAGIKAGDKILKIDGKTTQGMATENAVKLIRGKKGTTVILAVLHEGAKNVLEISIIRDVITIPTIETELRPDGVFVLTLKNFSAVSTDLFRQALREFIESSTDKLVLDLRGNPGGYMEAAIEMASWFLPPGKTVVNEQGKNGDPKIYRSRGYNIFRDNVKIAILINGGSASASEILAGALRENNRATLVGEKTFGKGSVQELVKVTDDTSLKVTIARWFTPNGVSISEEGIMPILKPAATPSLKKRWRFSKIKNAKQKTQS